jgi:hypothetical protein
MSPNMLVVIEQCVGGRGRDGCKAERISNGKGRRNKERTVSVVIRKIERAIHVDDPGGIV